MSLRRVEIVASPSSSGSNRLFLDCLTLKISGTICPATQRRIPEVWDLDGAARTTQCAYLDVLLFFPKLCNVTTKTKTVTIHSKVPCTSARLPGPKYASEGDFVNKYNC